MQVLDCGCMYMYMYISVVPKYESVRKLSSNLPLRDSSYREFLVKISARNINI